MRASCLNDWPAVFSAASGTSCNSSLFSLTENRKPTGPKNSRRPRGQSFVSSLSLSLSLTRQPASLMKFFFFH